MTWPLAIHAGDRTPSRWGDSKITVWVLAWDAHALAHDPAALFQAPVFHPQRDALTYADNLLGVGVVAAPITWATGNIYLAHNVVFIGSIAFGAFAAFLLGFELTGRRSAAAVAGAAFAAAPYWYGPIVNTSHLPILASGWMPMACFALIRWWRTENTRWIGLVAVSYVMASLTSWHQATFLAVALVLLAIGLVIQKRPARPARAVASALAAAAIAGLVLLPVALPYKRVQDRDPRYTRTLAQAAEISAKPSSFLTAPRTNRLYGAATARWREKQTSLETELFPGVAVVALAGVGLVSSLRTRGERLRGSAFAAIALAGAVLSMGTAPRGFRSHLPWGWLYDHVILFRSVRAPARAQLLTILGLTALAAFGARAAVTAAGRREAWVAAGLTALLVAEGLAIPLRLGPAPSPAPVYETLAGARGAILELPMVFPAGNGFDERLRGRDLDYMLYQTAHWRPLVNGALGYTPSSYFDAARAAAALPSSDAVAYLRSIGVGTIILHTDAASGTPWEVLEENASRNRDLVLRTDGDGIVVYDLVSR